MNERIPVLNNTAMPMYVAGIDDSAGRDPAFSDAEQVPAHLRPVAVEAEAEADAWVDPLEALVAKSVKAIIESFPDLSDMDLARVLELDAASETPRKTLHEAVTAEQLARATAKAEGAGAEGKADPRVTMAGTMSRADLIADFKASIHDAASVFTAASDGDFSRMLDVAALDLGRVRPNPLKGSITVAADTVEYAAPVGITAYSYSAWSAGKMPNPWAVNYPGPEPRVSLIGPPGARVLYFEPAPTALQVALFGATFPFRYLGGYM
jgi:hypothetical protein